MNITQLSDNLKSYISLQVDTMSKSTPLIGLMKPVITRVLDKNFSKVTKALDLIADDNGNIDIENILAEMIDNINTIEPFTLNTPFAGNIEIGGGNIKLNVPLTNKKLIFNSEDLETFKEMLINKSE